MTSDDGMDWLDAASPADGAFNPDARAYETVGRTAKLNLYNVVRRTFDDLCQKSGLTRKQLADRLGTSPALVSRLLVRPSNMTIETAAKLMFAMGEELSIQRRAAGFVYAGGTPRMTWAAPEAQITLVGQNVAIRMDTSSASSAPMSANALFLDAGPGLRAMRITSSGCSADGIWEQIQPAKAELSPILSNSSTTRTPSIQQQPIIDA